VSFFDGEIAHVDKERGYCVQKAGNSLTVHRLEALETVPGVGEKVRITYPKDEGRKAGVETKASIMSTIQGVTRWRLEPVFEAIREDGVLIYASE